MTKIACAYLVDPQQALNAANASSLGIRFKASMAFAMSDSDVQPGPAFEASEGGPM